VRGAGVTKDDARGDPGCGGLGLMDERGIGVAVDQAKAIELYREGCAAHDPWFCDRLKRLGVPAGVPASP
jgi:TPR repeat protein